MIYAVDTNIIYDIFFDDPVYSQPDIDFLNSLSPLDSLVACDVVWAEAATIRAGEIWKRARLEAARKKETLRLAIVPDFLIGAHAMECSDALITRDRGFMRRWFTDLKIVDPSAQ